MEDNKTKENILEQHYQEAYDATQPGHRYPLWVADEEYVHKAMESYSQQSTKQLQDRIDELTEALKWCHKLVDNMPDELYVKIEKLLNTKS